MQTDLLQEQTWSCTQRARDARLRTLICDLNYALTKLDHTDTRYPKSLRSKDMEFACKTLYCADRVIGAVPLAPREIEEISDLSGQLRHRIEAWGG